MELKIPGSVWATKMTTDTNNFTFQKYPGPEGPRNKDEPERIKIDFDQFVLEYDIKTKDKINTYKYLFELNELDLLEKMYKKCLYDLNSKFITITGINTSKNISVVVFVKLN